MRRGDKIVTTVDVHGEVLCYVEAGIDTGEDSFSGKMALVRYDNPFTGRQEDVLYKLGDFETFPFLEAAIKKQMVDYGIRI